MILLKKHLLNILLLGCLVAAGCVPYYQIAKTENTVYPMDSLAVSNTEVEALVAPFKAQLDAEMNKVIGEVKQDLPKEKPESLLGNFVADAILVAAKKHYDQPIDFAVSNYGGLRVPNIPAGPITTGMIFELMPFENRLTVVHLDGKTTKQFFEHMVAKGGWPVSTGVQVKVSNVDSVSVQQIMIDDAIFNEKQTYHILTSDYIANGGDQCDFLKGKDRDDIGLLFRDALIEYTKMQTAAGNSIDAALEGRTYFGE